MALNPSDPKPPSEVLDAGPLTFGRSKRFAFSLNVGLMVVISLAILVGLNWLSARPQLWKRFDVSSSKVYTLGEKTRQVLENLEEDVEAYIYADSTGALAEQRPSLFARSTDHVQSVLGEYEKLSEGRLELVYWQELEPTRQFQISSEIGGFERPNVVLFRSGEQIKIIDIPATAITEEEGERRDGRVREPRIIGWRSEDLFTSAIVEVTETGSPIYFTVGHGEASIRPETQSYTLIADWAASLRQDGYRVGELNLADLGAVPEDADVVVVAMPSTAFSPVDVAALREYVSGGGRLIWLDSSVVQGGGQSPVPSPELFGPYGVSVLDRVILQQPPSQAQNQLGNEAFFVLNLALLEHPITRPLLQYRVGILAYFARPIETEIPTPSNVTISPLLRSRPNAWLRELRTDLSPEEIAFDQITDVARRYDTGVAIEVEGAGDRPGQIVLLNGSLSIQALAGSANKNLFVNAVNWLAEREHLIGIDPKDYEERAIMLDYDRIETLQSVALIFIPAGLVLLGLFVWWTRRN